MAREFAVVVSQLWALEATQQFFCFVIHACMSYDWSFVCAVFFLVITMLVHVSFNISFESTQNNMILNYLHRSKKIKVCGFLNFYKF